MRSAQPLHVSIPRVIEAGASKLGTFSCQMPQNWVGPTQK